MEQHTMPDPQDIVVKITSWADEDGVSLRARQQAEVRALYAEGQGPEPSEADVPIFVMLYYKGTPIACGGIKPLTGEEAKGIVPEGTCAEVKRMYVVPELRGKSKGVGGLLMAQLERQCAEGGWTTIRIETDIDNLGAIKYYERHGYRSIPMYGPYLEESSVCFEKVLAPPTNKEE